MTSPALQHAPQQSKPLKHVQIGAVSAIREVPRDQENPVSVWNVYAPVRYVTRKEQRLIEKQNTSRSKDIMELCSNLFESGGQNERTEDASKHIIASFSFIMSVWPSFPSGNRPTVSVATEKALERLYKGTNSRLFNGEAGSPVECLVALRLLRNMDADEGSIAIYSSGDGTSIDGYIPLAYMYSITRGLERIEYENHVVNGNVMCTDKNGSRIILSPSRAFTIHCRSPQNFYVSFIALDDEDLTSWLCALAYFIELNRAFCRHMQSTYAE